VTEARERPLQGYSCDQRPTAPAGSRPYAAICCNMRPYAAICCPVPPFSTEVLRRKGFREVPRWKTAGSPCLQPCAERGGEKLVCARVPKADCGATHSRMVKSCEFDFAQLPAEWKPFQPRELLELIEYLTFFEFL
jgi:hypothetical protein